MWFDWKRLSLFTVLLLLFTCTQGADEAGDRIATLDVFKNAQNIKVDPDKPLQQARYITLKVWLSLDACMIVKSGGIYKKKCADFVL